MSHSKYTKRGKSLYVEKWNPSAQKYINTCSICGKQGYRPSIEQEGFRQTDLEYGAIYAELTKTLKPLPVDSLGRCEMCAAMMEK